MASRGQGDCYENRPKHPAIVVPAPPIRHSRDGGNPSPAVALNSGYECGAISSLGAPVATGMSSYYENSRPTPPTVIPAKAGIQSQGPWIPVYAEGTGRPLFHPLIWPHEAKVIAMKIDRSTPPSSFPRPQSVIPATAGIHPRPLPSTRGTSAEPFHPLVRRSQPA